MFDRYADTHCKKDILIICKFKLDWAEKYSGHEKYIDFISWISSNVDQMFMDTLELWCIHSPIVCIYSDVTTDITLI